MLRTVLPRPLSRRAVEYRQTVPSAGDSMRGPGYRNDLDVRRLWRCPSCGAERKLAGDVTTVACACGSRPTLMELIETQRRTPRPQFSPDGGELTVESFALTEAELATPLPGRIRRRTSFRDGPPQPDGPPPARQDRSRQDRPRQDGPRQDGPMPDGPLPQQETTTTSEGTPTTEPTSNSRGQRPPRGNRPPRDNRGPRDNRPPREPRPPRDEHRPPTEETTPPNAAPPNAGSPPVTPTNDPGAGDFGAGLDTHE
jgi:hypothetical protein